MIVLDCEVTLYMKLFEASLQTAKYVNIIQKNVFVENVLPANLALFIYVSTIASKQLNGLTIIDSLR